MSCVIDEGRPLVMVYKDGELGIRLEGLNELIMNRYWTEVRWQIHDGFIEEGRLNWDDVTSIVRAMNVLRHDATVPDDIIGEFAKRGYGEFHPDKDKEEPVKENDSED